VQSFTSALGQQQQPAQQAEETRKQPALAEFQSLLGDAQAAEREQPDQQADKTLQQFLQWRQKAGEPSP
jgi:hypothetical protein